MRYQNIDLNQKNNNQPTHKLTINDKTDDVYFAQVMSEYNIDKDILINQLRQNPLLHRKDNPIQIKRIEDYIVTTKQGDSSIGKIVMSNMSNLKKRRIINNYFRDCLDEYNIIVKKEYEKMDNLKRLTDYFKPHYVKGHVFIMFAAFSVVMYLLNFPFSGLKNWSFLHINTFYANLDALYANSFWFNFLHYLSFLAPLVILVSSLIYTVVAKIMEKKYKNISKDKLSSIISMQSKMRQKVEAMKRFLLRQAYKKDIAKKDIYDLNKLYNNEKLLIENIQSYSTDGLDTMSKIEKTAKAFNLIRIIMLFMAVAIMISFIVLMIIKLTH